MYSYNKNVAMRTKNLQVGILECKNLKKMDITGASGEEYQTHILILDLCDNS